MSIQMQQFTTGNAQLNPTERAMWDLLRAKLTPVVWIWYDAHKNQKVTTIFKLITVYVGSFGIAEAIITGLFGPRP